MERLTVPDERIDEHTTRRTVIDADKVREHAMDFYWALKRYEDTFLTPEEITKIRADVENGYLKSTARRYGVPVDRLRELAQADRDGRCVVLPTFCDGCVRHSEHDGKHWCKFWHRYCPDDSEFYCKAAKNPLEGGGEDE